MTTQLVLGVFVAFFAAQLTVETALSLMNLSHVARAGDAVPPALRGEVDAETARRSRDYTLARGRFGLVHGAFGGAVTLTLLFSGVLPGLDAGLGRLGLTGAHRFVAFLAALSVLGGVLDLPFSLWSTFVLEARFGFNRVTPGLWLKDRLKGIALGAAIGLLLLYGAYGFFALTGRAWWLWLFAFLTAVQVLMVWLYPTLIAPLFNRFSPLPEGELRTRLEALAREARFRTRGLFVMDASRGDRTARFGAPRQAIPAGRVVSDFAEAEFDGRSRRRRRSSTGRVRGRLRSGRRAAQEPRGPPDRHCAEQDPTRRRAHQDEVGRDPHHERVPADAPAQKAGEDVGAAQEHQGRCQDCRRLPRGQPGATESQRRPHDQSQGGQETAHVQER
jgi:hypothetical protein